MNISPGFKFRPRGNEGEQESHWSKATNVIVSTQKLGKNGLKDPTKMWDGGIIPYDMSDIRKKGVVLQAFRYIGC